jgi:formylglycine-generating enzyme required for sulfatase activity
MSWVDCLKFCEKLGKRAGRPFRLPTEVEWEYACRAGTTSPYSCGASEKALARAAWYEGNSEGETHPVGQKEPNAWGLHDMHGQVWEWCADRHRGFDEDASLEIHAGLIGEEPEDAVAQRGGSWWNAALDCRSASRVLDALLQSGYGTIGVRVVMELASGVA